MKVSKRRQSIYVTLPPELHEEIVKRAELEDRPVSRIVERAARVYLRRVPVDRLLGETSNPERE